jgi:hypothetical protein
METTLLAQTAHVQKVIAALDSEAYYWRLNHRLGLQVAALSAQLFGLGLEIASIDRDVRDITQAGELDPDDALVEKLLLIQQAISANHQACSPGHWPLLRWHQRVALKLLRWLLLTIHQRLARLQVYIQEHDADVAGLSSTSAFTHPDQLFNHLKGL